MAFRHTVRILFFAHNQRQFNFVPTDRCSCRKKILAKPGRLWYTILKILQPRGEWHGEKRSKPHGKQSVAYLDSLTVY